MKLWAPGSWPWCEDCDQRGTNEPACWWPQRPLQVVLSLQEQLRVWELRGATWVQKETKPGTSLPLPSRQSCNQNTDRAAPCWGPRPPTCLRAGDMRWPVSTAHSPEDCDPHTVLTLKLKMIAIYGHVQSWASDGTMFAQQHVLKGKHQGKILFLKKHVKSTISERRS